MGDESRVINCRGCGGTGKKRIQPGQSWCGRCSGTGHERGGFPGFETLKTCHICGGDGLVDV